MEITPLKAIHKKCLECVGRPSLVRRCDSKDCPLFVYRFGKNPKRSGIGSVVNLQKAKFHQKSKLSGQFLEKLEKLGITYDELKKAAQEL
jgi:hypothetical protein